MCDCGIDMYVRKRFGSSKRNFPIILDLTSEVINEMDRRVRDEEYVMSESDNGGGGFGNCLLCCLSQP